MLKRSDKIIVNGITAKLEQDWNMPLLHQLVVRNGTKETAQIYVVSSDSSLATGIDFRIYSLKWENTPSHIGKRINIFKGNECPFQNTDR